MPEVLRAFRSCRMGPGLLVLRSALSTERGHPMSSSNSNDFDVIIIGGGPAASVAGCLSAQHGYRALVLERNIHPRDHVGESLTPSSNFIFKRIGFLEKMEDAGFVHKPGAAWTAPRSPVGKYV